MPMIEVDGCRLNVEVEGRTDAPPLMRSNSLIIELHTWSRR